jgi:hypothetical protein
LVSTLERKSLHGASEEPKMKRHSSLLDIQRLNDRKDALFCHNPPHCSFNDEDGYARREFCRLAPKEQAKVMKDIYGIEESSDDEDRGFIESALHRLEEELQVYVGKKKGLDTAKKEHSAFYEDEAFRLKFLKSDNYNPKLAARRLIRYLDKKLELFGAEKLSKSISLDDLNEDDVECLSSGGVQPLSEKDRGGRKIFYSRHENWKYKEVANMVRTLLGTSASAVEYKIVSHLSFSKLRACWYLGSSCLDEKDCSRGVVVISYQNGPFSTEIFDRSVFKSVMDLGKIFPAKLAGYHFCFDDIRFRMVWGLATVFVGKYGRLRSRDHEGTHVECRYGLMSYGIPVDAMPIDIDGVEDNSGLLKWIEDRRQNELKTS